MRAHAPQPPRDSYGTYPGLLAAQHMQQAATPDGSSHCQHALWRHGYDACTSTALQGLSTCPVLQKAATDPSHQRLVC